MKLNYNVTGENRKQMVAIISREAGVQAVYTRMPECAYVIGNVKVTKTGELLWDDRTDAALIERITAALSAEGFVAQAEENETEEKSETEAISFRTRQGASRCAVAGAMPLDPDLRTSFNALS